MRFSRAGRQKLTLHQRIARYAGAQDGLIVAAQLREAGLSDEAMSRWARSGRLHRLHRGVYAVGHTALSERAVHRAALLAVDDRAALCLWSSAHRLGLTRRPPHVVHVAFAHGRRTSIRSGISVHYLRSMIDRDVAVVDGLRCTTAARTLVDLAGRPECQNLTALCEQAEFLGLLDLVAIDEVIRRLGHPHGARRLRETLAAASLGTSSAGSRLERRVLRALLDSGISRPVLQQQLGRMRVDFFWPRHRLVVEVDGPHHERPLQRAKDEARDAALAGRGLMVLRIRAADFAADPCAEVARVAHAMRVSGGERQKRAPHSAE